MVSILASWIKSKAAEKIQGVTRDKTGWTLFAYYTNEPSIKVSQ